MRDVVAANIYNDIRSDDQADATYPLRVRGGDGPDSLYLDKLTSARHFHELE